jgi:hypothetical protein
VVNKQDAYALQLSPGEAPLTGYSFTLPFSPHLNGGLDSRSSQGALRLNLFGSYAFAVHVRTERIRLKLRHMHDDDHFDLVVWSDHDGRQLRFLHSDFGPTVNLKPPVSTRRY